MDSYASTAAATAAVVDIATVDVTAVNAASASNRSIVTTTTTTTAHRRKSLLPPSAPLLPLLALSDLVLQSTSSPSSSLPLDSHHHHHQQNTTNNSRERKRSRSRSRRRKDHRQSNSDDVLLENERGVDADDDFDKGDDEEDDMEEEAEDSEDEASKIHKAHHHRHHKVSQHPLFFSILHLLPTLPSNNGNQPLNSNATAANITSNYFYSASATVLAPVTSGNSESPNNNFAVHGQGASSSQTTPSPASLLTSFLRQVTPTPVSPSTLPHSTHPMHNENSAKLPQMAVLVILQLVSDRLRANNPSSAQTVQRHIMRLQRFATIALSSPRPCATHLTLYALCLVNRMLNHHHHHHNTPHSRHYQQQHTQHNNNNNHHMPPPTLPPSLGSPSRLLLAGLLLAESVLTDTQTSCAIWARAAGIASPSEIAKLKLDALQRLQWKIVIGLEEYGTWVARVRGLLAGSAGKSPSTSSSALGLVGVNSAAGVSGASSAGLLRQAIASVGPAHSSHHPHHHHHNNQRTPAPTPAPPQPPHASLTTSSTPTDHTAIGSTGVAIPPPALSINPAAAAAAAAPPSLSVARHHHQLHQRARTKSTSDLTTLADVMLAGGPSSARSSNSELDVLFRIRSNTDVTGAGGAGASGAEGDVSGGKKSAGGNGGNGRLTTLDAENRDPYSNSPAVAFVDDTEFWKIAATPPASLLHFQSVHSLHHHNPNHHGHYHQSSSDHHHAGGGGVGSDRRRRTSGS